MVDQQRQKKSSFVREIVFGLEDSLVSTLGTVTGIAAGTQDSRLVVLSGLVLIAVESVSMSAGSYLSSKAATEVDATKERPLRAAGVMLVAYLFGGLFPLVPYLIFSTQQALLPSVLATVVVLTVLGIWKGKVAKESLWKSAAEMVGVSLAAALIGYGIGRLASQLLGIPVF